MGALNPVFLVAALAVAVPVLVHLLHRRDARTFIFPALRYLVRTERDRSRRIRLRQLLLLALRIATVLLLVAAGARLYWATGSGGHPPTAVALVIDNSLSSGLVSGEERVLDELVGAALSALEQANEEDRFWIVRAGEPWVAATPLSAAQAASELEEIEPSDARAEIGAALARARSLLAEVELARREIHLLSDMQATGFTGEWPSPDSGAADLEPPRPLGDPLADALSPGASALSEASARTEASARSEAGALSEASVRAGAFGNSADAEAIPLLAFSPATADWSNLGITSALVGDGFAPAAGRRTDVTVALSSPASGAGPASIRVVVNDRLRQVATLLPGTSGRLDLPSSTAGWVHGYVESEPDLLRADDRRHFAYRTLPPAAVAVAGDAGLFVSEALGVLAEAGRITLSEGRDAELLVTEGALLAEAVAETALLILPPADPSRLPALNRRLAELGIGWRLASAAESGGFSLAPDALPEALANVRVERAYDLTWQDPGSVGVTGRTLVSGDGGGWAVEGVDGRGRRYLLLASPLDEYSTSLPTSAAMVPFIDWIASSWTRRAPGTNTTPHLAGLPLPAPPGAVAVRLPSGRELPVDGSRNLAETAEAGLYAFLAAAGAETEGLDPAQASASPEAVDSGPKVAADGVDTGRVSDPVAAPGRSLLDRSNPNEEVVAWVAVVPDPRESELVPLSDEQAARILGGVTPVEDAREWADTVFHARSGPELWRFLLGAALVLLVLEGLVATSKARGSA